MTRAEQRRRLAPKLAAALRGMLHNQPEDPHYAEPEEWEKWERTEQRALAVLREWNDLSPKRRATHLAALPTFTPTE